MFETPGSAACLHARSSAKFYWRFPPGRLPGVSLPWRRGEAPATFGAMFRAGAVADTELGNAARRQIYAGTATIVPALKSREGHPAVSSTGNWGAPLWRRPRARRRQIYARQPRPRRREGHPRPLGEELGFA